MKFCNIGADMGLEKISSEEILEKLVTDTIEAIKGKPFKLTTTLSLEIKGELRATPSGELEVDELDILIKDLQGNVVSDGLLTTLEEVLADSINDAVSTNDPTDVMDLDVLCEEINSSLEVLEAKAIKLEELLAGKDIEWPDIDWAEIEEYSDIWDAVVAEAEFRTQISIKPSSSSPFMQKPQVQTTPAPQTAKEKELPRAFAASPIKKTT